MPGVEESDQEFLLRMGGSVNSECWGTVEQEADQARIKSIANRLRDRDYQIDMYTKYNNPNGYRSKYARDGGQSMTLGDLAQKIVTTARNGADDDEMVKLIDEEFLFGAWRGQTEDREPDFLRDLRGLIINLARRARKRP